MSETKNIIVALSKLSANARNVFATETGVKSSKYSKLNSFIGEFNDLMELLELSLHIIPGKVEVNIEFIESQKKHEVVGKVSCMAFLTHLSGEMLDLGISEFPLEIGNGMTPSAKANAANTYLRKLIILGLCNIHFTDDEIVFISQVDEFIESIGTSLLDEASIFMHFGDLKLKFEMAKNQKALDYLNSRKHEMTRRKNDLLSRVSPSNEIISSNEYKQLLDTIKDEFEKHGSDLRVDDFMEGFKSWYAGFSDEKGDRIDDPRKMLREHLNDVFKELPELIADYCKF